MVELGGLRAQQERRPWGGESRVQDWRQAPTCQLCTLACSPPGGWWGGVGGSLQQSHVDRQSEAREDWL